MLEMIRAALLAVIGTQTELRLRPGSDSHDAYLRLTPKTACASSLDPERRDRSVGCQWPGRPARAPPVSRLLSVSRTSRLLYRLRSRVRGGDFTVKKTGGTHQAGWAWVYDLRDGQITRILATQDLSGVANEVGSALTKATGGGERCVRNRLSQTSSSVLQTDNMRRVRDGYMCESTRGHARALAAHR
jgi:hypothetical protein